MAEFLHQFMLPPIPPRFNVDVRFFHPGRSSKKINIEQGGCGGVICLEEFASRVVQDFGHQPLQKSFEVRFYGCDDVEVLVKLSMKNLMERDRHSQQLSPRRML